jgi:hypothetical protein
LGLIFKAKPFCIGLFQISFIFNIPGANTYIFKILKGRKKNEIKKD